MWMISLPLLASERSTAEAVKATARIQTHRKECGSHCGSSQQEDARRNRSRKDYKRSDKLPKRHHIKRVRGFQMR